MRNAKWIVGLGLLSLAGMLAGCTEMAMPCCRGSGAAVSGPAATVVNSHCPMMGNAIDSARVALDLTRDYNGQKVGFCCGGCPAAWDRLTPEQKEAKLKAAG